MKNNKTIETLKLENDQKNKGMISEWQNHSYDKNLYYVSASGLICPLPDDISLRKEVRDEILDEIRK